MKKLPVILVAIAIIGCAKINEEELLLEAKVKELCEVDTVSFSQHVFPIFEKECLHCHSSGHHIEGGINLENYNEISNYTATNYLVQVIKHESGVRPMPENADKLHDCEIQAIERWIQQGAPNN